MGLSALQRLDMITGFQRPGLQPQSMSFYSYQHCPCRVCHLLLPVNVSVLFLANANYWAILIEQILTSSIKFSMICKSLRQQRVLVSQLPLIFLAVSFVYYLCVHKYVRKQSVYRRVHNGILWIFAGRGNYGNQSILKRTNRLNRRCLIWPTNWYFTCTHSSLKNKPWWPRSHN